MLTSTDWRRFLWKEKETLQNKTRNFRLLGSIGLGGKNRILIEMKLNYFAEQIPSVKLVSATEPIEIIVSNSSLYY